MAERSSREHDDHKSLKRAEHESAQSAAHAHVTGSHESAPSDAGALPGLSSLTGRGNQPVKVAAIQAMQQSYGNRAVQRFHHRRASTAVPANDQQQQTAAPGQVAGYGSDAESVQQIPAASDAPAQESVADASTSSQMVQPIVRRVLSNLRADPYDRSGRARALLARLSPAARQAALAQLKGHVSQAQLDRLSRVASTPTAATSGSSAAPSKAAPREGTFSPELRL